MTPIGSFSNSYDSSAKATASSAASKRPGEELNTSLRKPGARIDHSTNSDSKISATTLGVLASSSIACSPEALTAAAASTSSPASYKFSILITDPIELKRLIIEAESIGDIEGPCSLIARLQVKSKSVFSFLTSG